MKLSKQSVNKLKLIHKIKKTTDKIITNSAINVNNY